LEIAGEKCNWGESRGKCLRVLDEKGIGNAQGKDGVSCARNEKGCKKGFRRIAGKGVQNNQGGGWKVGYRDKPSVGSGRGGEK